MIQIEKENQFMPKYLMIYNDLQEKILNREYKEKDILPSEPKLQEHYNVSRITVRKAMDKLQQKGFIKKIPGVGTTVISNKTVLELNKLSSFSDENYEQSNELVDFRIIVPPLHVRTNLELSAEEKVYEIKRIRKSVNKKIGLHCAYVPVKYLILTKDNFIHKEQSLYKLFNENDIYLDQGWETIEAINITSYLKKLLDIKDDSPILYKERTSFSEGRPVEFVEIYYRGDMYKYHIEIT